MPFRRSLSLAILLFVLTPGFTCLLIGDGSAVVRTVPVGDGPYAVRVRGDSAFVTRLFPETPEDPNIIEVDWTAGTLRQSYRIGRRAFEVGIFQKYLLIINGDKDFLTLVDQDTKAVAYSIPVGSRPSDVTVFDPLGLPPGQSPAFNFPLAIVANGSSGDVTLVNLDSKTAIGTIPVGKDPRGVVVHPNGRYAYVTLGGEASLAVVHLMTGEVTKIWVAHDPGAIDIGRGGQRAVLTSLTTNSVSILDLAKPELPWVMVTGGRVGRVQLPVGIQPTGVTISPDEKTAYIGNLGSSWISVLDLERAMLKGVYMFQRAGSTATTAATGVRLTEDGNYLLVVERGNDARLLVLDVSQMQLEQAPFIAIPGEPEGLVPLEIDPSYPCPGYYTATVKLPDGADGGTWGMEILLTRGSRLLQGGLNVGGAFSEDGRITGYGAFNVSNPRNEAQIVSVEVNAQAAETQGFSLADFGVTVVMTDSSRNPIGPPVTGPPFPIKFQQVLQPGFYIVKVTSKYRSPRGLFQMSMLTRYADETHFGGAFQGGVNVGGYLMRMPGGESSTGFAGFCISEPQNVFFRSEGYPTRGPIGSDEMIVCVQDRFRNPVYSFPPPVPNPPRPVLPLPPDLEGAQPTIYVDDDAGSDGNGSAARPYGSITAAIQRAVSGDVILVREGIYSPSLTGEVMPIGVFPEVKSGVSIIGSGAEFTVIDAENATRGTESLMAVVIPTDRVRFAGFTVKNGSMGIWALNGTGIRVDHNYCTGNNRFGIGASKTDGIVIADNLAIANEETGIAVAGAGTPTAGNPVSVSGCPAQFGACVIRNISNLHRADGILLTQGGEYHVLDNGTYNNGVSGIELNNGGEPGQTYPPLIGYCNGNITNNNGGVQYAFVGTGILVTEGAVVRELNNNTVVNNRPGGIAVFEDSHADQIKNNVISNNSESGLIIQKRSSAGEVLHNTITDNGLCGIFIENEAEIDSIEDNTVTGNGSCTACVGAKDGIAVLGGSSVNRIEKVVVEGNAGGLQVANNSSVQSVRNSTFNENAVAGVFVSQNSALEEFTLNQVQRNKGEGGFVITSSRGLLSQSSITDNTGVGLSVRGMDFVVSDCVVSRNTGNGLSLSLGAKVTSDRNTIESNGGSGIASQDAGTKGTLRDNRVCGNQTWELEAHPGSELECLGGNTICGAIWGIVLSCR